MKIRHVNDNVPNKSVILPCFVRSDSQTEIENRLIASHGCAWKKPHKGYRQLLCLVFYSDRKESDDTEEACKWAKVSNVGNEADEEADNECNDPDETRE